MLRDVEWYQARFSKAAYNYKTRSHGFVPKSPEDTGEMTLNLAQWESKEIVHHIPSTLNYKCLRTAGFYISGRVLGEKLRGGNGSCLFF